MTGKIAMISGASRGIGRAIAEQLHASGYRLSLGLRQPDALSNSPLASSDSVQHVAFEATNAHDAQQWVAACEARFGGIDVLINCAGVLRLIGIDDDNDQALDEMWAVNVKAPLRLTRLAAHALRRSGQGRIINLVSMSGKRVKGRSAGYAMSKHAQLAMSHAARNTLWDDGVRVTAIFPSWVATEMAEISGLEAGQMSQPEDIARLVQQAIELPNSSYLNDVTVNCALET